MRNSIDLVGAGLEGVRSFDAFREVCAPLGIHRSERFVHLELDIINKCNIRCVMCHQSLDAVRRAPTVGLTPEGFDRMASPILRHAYFLSLSLGAEPLLSPHFTAILEIVGRHGVPNVNFFTNGLLLDDEKTDAIIGCGVTQVCISIDGATASTYNDIRRGGDFDRLIGNVERLVERREAAGSPTPRVRFDFVMMRRNIHEIVDLVHLARRLGADSLNFSHLICFEGLGMEEESLSRHRRLSNRWLHRAIDTAHDLGLDVQFQPAAFEQPDPPAAGGRSVGSRVRRVARRVARRDSRRRDGQPRPPDLADVLPPMYCPYPFFHITVGSGGRMHACPYAHGEDPYAVLADGTGIEQVWFGPEFTNLRQHILRADPLQMCRRCPFLANRFPDVPGLFATRRSEPDAEAPHP
jgi:MoaA/NifB/PqqE/SkfB family radical SAM enzyme